MRRDLSGCLILGLAMLTTACAHAPPPPPPPDPCVGIDDPGRAPRNRYPEPLWVVGVGESSGWSSAAATQKAQTAAASAVASQLLVRVQSTLQTRESQSTATGVSSRVERKVDAVVDEVRLPGLVQVQTCFNPATLTTKALAVLHRGEAHEAFDRLQRDEAARLSTAVAQLQSLVTAGRVLEAIRSAAALTGDLERFRTQTAVATALGVETDASLSDGWQTFLRDLSTRRVVTVVPSGRMSEPVFAPLAAEVTAMTTGQGWAVSGTSSDALIRLELSVDGCSEAPVRELGAVRARCSVAARWVEATTGQVLESAPPVVLEGVAATADRALAEAVRSGAPLVSKALRPVFARLVGTGE